MSKWYDFICREKKGSPSAPINGLSGASNRLMNVLFIGMNIRLHWLLRSREPVKCVKSKHSGRMKTQQHHFANGRWTILGGRNANQCPVKAGYYLYEYSSTLLFPLKSIRSSMILGHSFGEEKSMLIYIQMSPKSSFSILVFGTKRECKQIDSQNKSSGGTIIKHQEIQLIITIVKDSKWEKCKMMLLGHRC